jgi:hypothetical protein
MIWKKRFVYDVVEMILDGGMKGEGDWELMDERNECLKKNVKEEVY